MKCENFQKTGSFKFIGAFNACHNYLWNRRRRVITHSSGNHAQAPALAAKLLGIKVVILMHKNAPSVKVAATNIVNGKDVTCFNDADMITDLINSGAIVDMSQSVIRDENIITANGPQAIDAFAEKIISALMRNTA